jgi:hypothetical protein
VSIGRCWYTTVKKNAAYKKCRIGYPLLWILDGTKWILACIKHRASFNSASINHANLQETLIYLCVHSIKHCKRAIVQRYCCDKNDSYSCSYPFSLFLNLLLLKRNLRNLEAFVAHSVMRSTMMNFSQSKSTDRIIIINLLCGVSV